VLVRLLPGVTRAISDGEGDRPLGVEPAVRSLFRKGLGMLSGESGNLIGYAQDGIFISTCRGFPPGGSAGEGSVTGGASKDLRGGMGNSRWIGDESELILVGVTGIRLLGAKRDT
jgi:hypothetical protein